MKNSEIITRLKSLKMPHGFTLTLKDDTHPGQFPFVQSFDFTEVHLKSDRTLLNVRIIHDDDDDHNNKVAQGALMIVESFID